MFGYFHVHARASWLEMRGQYIDAIVGLQGTQTDFFSGLPVAGKPLPGGVGQYGKTLAPLAVSPAPRGYGTADYSCIRPGADN
jgi:hypothetical protein